MRMTNAHRDGKRFIVRTYEKLTTFPEFERFSASSFL